MRVSLAAGLEVIQVIQVILRDDLIHHRRLVRLHHLNRHPEVLADAEIWSIEFVRETLRVPRPRCRSRRQVNPFFLSKKQLPEISVASIKRSDILIKKMSLLIANRAFKTLQNIFPRDRQYVLSCLVVVRPPCHFGRSPFSSFNIKFLS